MTPTPEQEEALNRAIAEHEGWDSPEDWHCSNCDQYISSFKVNYQEQCPNCFHGGTLCGINNYTRDLNAIVDVVERWCEAHDEVWHLCWLRVTKKFQAEVCRAKRPEDMFLAATPALALCIAFAQAAGLDWEGNK